MTLTNILLMLFGISVLIFLFRKFFGNTNVTQPTNTTPIIVSGGSSGGGSGGGSVSINNAITIINQALADIYTGTNNVSVVLTAPTITGDCVDSNTRKVSTVANGIVLKKNGNITLSVGDTFLATDVITINVNSSLFPNTTQQEVTHPNYVLFTYKAVGACGDSNEAQIKTNIKVAAANPTLPAFEFQDGYMVNGNYTPYASLVDAMDKNFEGSGFTNRNATLYAAEMVMNGKAYANAQGTAFYPAGNYFYGADFMYLAINSEGTMFLFADIEKAPVNAFSINDGFNA